jgi:hypothetical protein
MRPDASENSQISPRPSFGLPELLVAIQPRVSLAARPEMREYLRQFGSHPGNPG